MEGQICRVRSKDGSHEYYHHLGGPKAQVAPNSRTGGGYVLDDEDFGNFMLSGMALTAADMTLKAFAYT